MHVRTSEVRYARSRKYTFRLVQGQKAVEGKDVFAPAITCGGSEGELGGVGQKLRVDRVHFAQC